MSPPAYIKYLSPTPHVESLQCLHVGNQEGPCFSSVQFAKINVVLSAKHFRTTTQ